MTENYIEQWKRVQRWYRRLNDIKIPKNRNQQDEVLDYYYAFLINLYHLKDWVKISNKSKGNELENMFDKDHGTEYFKVCADLVNGIKHLTTKRARIDKNTRVGRKSSTINLPFAYMTVGQASPSSEKTDKLPIYEHKYFVKSNGKEYDISTICDECYKELNKFMKEFKTNINS